MKLKLSDVGFYGLWNSETEQEHKVISWLEKSSLRLFYTSLLIEDFGYKDCEEIEASGHFIPLFKIDEVALKKEFIASLNQKEAENEIQRIQKYNDECRKTGSYELAFNIFGEEHREFYDDYLEYEHSRCLKEAEEWCISNNLEYFTPKDAKRNLDLTETVLYRYGACLGVHGDEAFTYWFCKKDFSFMSPEDIKAKYGYESEEEIAASGDFIVFIRIDDDCFKDGYVEHSGGTKREDEVRLFMEENKECSYKEALFSLVYARRSFLTDWWRYKEKQELKLVEQWAVENNIPYFEYNLNGMPDHLGSQYRGDFK